MSGLEWGVNADPNPEPGAFLVEWRRDDSKDWKGGAKKKQVNIDIDLKGVTVTRVQSKKKDPKVGSWDWYHIKSWDVAKTHFGFKIVGADGAITDYIFETTQAKAIAANFKNQVNAIMGRKRKQKEAKESGGSYPDALPVLATRTKIMKVEVKFQTNGMLAPPPKSSLARGQTGAGPTRIASGSSGAAAAPAPAMESVEVLETDNPMSSLLDLFAGASTTAAAAPAPEPAPAMGGTGATGDADFFGAAAAVPAPVPAPAMGGTGATGGGDFFSTEAAATSQAAPHGAPATVAGMNLFGAGPATTSQVAPQQMDLMGATVGAGAPTALAAQQPMPTMQPTLNPATQPRTMAQIQATAAAKNPHLGAGPVAQNPFAMQQPFLQHQQVAPMNQFVPPPQPQAGVQNPFLAAPVPLPAQQQAVPPKPPNPFDSLI